MDGSAGLKRCTQQKFLRITGFGTLKCALVLPQRFWILLMIFFMVYVFKVHAKNLLNSLIDVDSADKVFRLTCNGKQIVMEEEEEKRRFLPEWFT